jgi:hypothetical protein
VTSGPALLLAPTFVLAFAFVSVAIGCKLMRRLGVAADTWEGQHLLVACALGAGALQFVPFTLGALRALSAVTLQLCLGALTLLLLPELKRTGQTLLHVMAQARAHSSRRRIVYGLLISPALITAALLALTPTIDPDGLSYHLTVPRRWLASHALSYLPTYPYSNTPMGVEMLFTVALALAGDAAAKLLHLTFGLLAAIGLYRTGKVLGSASVGTTAAILYLVGPAGAVQYLGYAYIEGAIGFALVSATLAWCVWFRERGAGWLNCSLLIAGIAVSFKLTTALFPIGLGVLTVLVLRSEGRKLASLWPLALRFGLLTALPIVPWLARSAIVTGNPFFPLFAGIIPSRDYPPNLARAFEEYNRYMLWGSQRLGHWGIEERRLALLALGAGLAVFAGLVYRRLGTRTARSVLVVLTLTVLIQLSAMGLYIRYWSPLLAVVQIPLLLVMDGLLRRPRAQTLVWAAAAVGSLLGSRSGLQSVGGDVSGLVRTAVGADDQRAFLQAHLPLYPLYEKANRELVTDARILLSSYCGGFYLERTTYCAEFINSSLRFTNWQEFFADVRALRVTHVLAPRSIAAGEGPATRVGGSVSEMFRDQQNELVGTLLREHCDLIATASDQGLYAIRIEQESTRAALSRALAP